MFGYVRPVLERLSQEEKTAYQSAYCGLCHVMGQRHGWLARFTLNYDFTFLALLHYGSSGSSDTVCRRCPAHPFRKARNCLCGTALEAAADESMILTWYKLCDDIADRGFLTGLPSRVLRFLLRKGYRCAAQARSEFDRNVRHQMERLSALEAERSPCLDRAADTFASILSAAANDCGEDEPRRRAMEQLLYQLGRWVYLIDAWDDLDEDSKAERYNPLDARFEGKAADEREYIETTMTHSLRLIHSAANLLDFDTWLPVVENILYSGLPVVQRSVLDGSWKELRKQGRRNTNERSV